LHNAADVLAPGMILQHHSQPSGYLRGIRLPPTPAPARPPYRRCFACWWDRSPASRQNFAPNEARRRSPTKRGADHLFHLSLRPGLRTLIQTGQGPDRRCCRPSSSAPSRQACAKMTGPSPATCSLNRMPASVCAGVAPELPCVRETGNRAEPPPRYRYDLRRTSGARWRAPLLLRPGC
jgi:hypothetical protein